MASPAQRHQRTPEPGDPARTAAWALLEAARQLSHAKHRPVGGVCTLQGAARRARPLSELAGLAASQRGKIEDRRLAAILDEIDLRARAELAKLAAAP